MIVVPVNTRDRILQGYGIRTNRDFLSIEEKPAFISEIASISARRDQLYTIASNNNLYALRNTHSSAVASLVSFVSSLVTPVPWNDLGNITTVDRDLLDSYLANVYSSQIALVSAIDNKTSIVGKPTVPVITIPCDSLGVVDPAVLALSGGTFKILRGSTDITTGKGIVYSIHSISSGTVTIDSATGVYVLTSMPDEFVTVQLKALLPPELNDIEIYSDYKVNKVKSGANGLRGSVAAYATGSSWTDAAANAAITASTGFSLKIRGDSVTISNGGTFVTMKVWNGTSWGFPGTIFDGNLLATGSVTAAKLITNGITVRDTLGNIMIGAGSPTDWTKLTASGLTGGSGILNSSISLNSSGALLGAGGGGVSIWSLGFTGALNATANTGLFANLPGTITSSNAATYFAANSIAGTYIANLAANKIQAGTLAVGVVYAGAVSANQITAGAISVPSNGGGIYIGGASGLPFPFNLSTFGILNSTGSAPALTVYSQVTSACINVLNNAGGTGISATAYSATAIYGLGAFSGGTGIEGVSSHGGGNGGAFSNSATGKAIYVGSGAYSAYSGSGQGKFYAVDGLGPFTGFHDSLIPKTAVYVQGDIIVDTGIAYKHDVSNCLMEVFPSTIENQKRVIGVATDSRDIDTFLELPYDIWWSYIDTHSLLSVNAVGEGQINVCGKNGSIEAGDFIVSSSMPGKGMKQSDDILRNYTVAKSRESVTFDYPEQVKMIACIYMCG